MIMVENLKAYFHIKKKSYLLPLYISIYEIQ